MPMGDMGLSGIDPNDSDTVAMTDPFTHVADGGNCCAGAYFYNHHRHLLMLGEKAVEAHLLAPGAVGKPGVVTEHQDVGAGWLTAVAALRNSLSAHAGDVDRDCFVIVPDVIAARGQTLQVVDRAVNFKDLIFPVSGFLKLTVDIRGGHETVLTELRGPVLQHLEAAMRFRFPIQVGAMTVEPPSEGRITLEIRRIGGIDEIDAEAFVHRVGAPEALVATEVGKAGVNSHAGTAGDEHGFGRFDRCSGFFETA